ncbi:MAG TPA: Mur ligase family protein [Candidatus Eremiobacteraceae bacterium]|nr:Mur ligase family protein [Candidatus Eremiobacteraceae bacterium]
MDFEQAVRLLDRSVGESRSARFPGRLDRMRMLLRELGEPQQHFKSIHVGGTAGKGSTATMIASILQAAGYKVGLHTKPHLHAVGERARIGMQAIDDQRFAELFEAMLPAIEQMRMSQWGPPSYFELLVALAFLYFAQESVDVGVIEVGVGGRLDGTNLIVPEAVVLTNVGTDHRDVLGDTVEEIAQDKAGIIKPHVPVVTAAEQPSVLEIISAEAQRKSAPLTVVADYAQLQSTVTNGSYAQALSVKTPLATHEFSLPLIGRFQAVNAATAIVAAEKVHAVLPTTPDNVVSGLSNISLPGRTEYYPARPALLFDVAHNVEKAAALRDALKRHFPERRFTFVVAVAEEKDVQGMLEAWQSLPAQFIFTRFEVSHRRSRHSRSLANAAEQLGLATRAVDDPIEALAVARRITGSTDLVVVTGSTFLVATLRQWFLDNAGQPKHVHA